MILQEVSSDLAERQRTSVVRLRYVRCKYFYMANALRRIYAIIAKSSVRDTYRITVASYTVQGYVRRRIANLYELVVGDVESTQRVQIVEIFGQCLELVEGHVEHLERTQLPNVRY